jgi:hypothetical protein
MSSATARDAILAARDLHLERFREIRAFTVALVQGLTEEDQQIQSMPDVSPTK